MKWKGRRQSRNIEDRRRSGGKGKAGIGGIGILVILAIGYFLGVDVTPLLNDPNLTGGSGQPVQQVELSAEDQAAAEFVSVVLADTEQVWAEIFDRQVGAAYNPPKLVLFSQVTQSACGNASGATGPFYCPPERKAFLDTSFFTTLKNRFGAGGDFAAAYVVAHEIAHHVQNELGILPKANAARQGASKADSNRISVMIELQADCFSGVWARYAKEQLGTIERGDIAEAMNAAKQIGDDTLQRNAGRQPMPHTFTHGTSAQRQDWFERGYESGDLNQCDTFNARSL